MNDPLLNALLELVVVVCFPIIKQLIESQSNINENHDEYKKHDKIYHKAKRTKVHKNKHKRFKIKFLNILQIEYDSGTDTETDLNNKQSEDDHHENKDDEI